MGWFFGVSKSCDLKSVGVSMEDEARGVDKGDVSKLVIAAVCIVPNVSMGFLLMISLADMLMVNLPRLNRSWDVVSKPIPDVGFYSASLLIMSRTVNTKRGKPSVGDHGMKYIILWCFDESCLWCNVQWYLQLMVLVDSYLCILHSCLLQA